MGQIENHVLTIDNRKAIALSGAADVLSFNEREIRFSLIGGGKVVVSGENLNIAGFSKQTGEAKLSGTINSVKYFTIGAPSLKKLFK